MTWTDTPPNDIRWAERPDGERVRYCELAVGDVFRPFFPPDGYVTIHCETQDGDIWYKVTDLPIKADGVQCLSDFGWAVMVVETKLLEAVH